MSAGRERVQSVHNRGVILTAALAMGHLALAGVATGFVLSGSLEPAFSTTPLLRGAVAVMGLLMLGAATVIGGRLAEAPAGATPDDAAQRYPTGLVVGMALREAVGLAGAMLILLAGDLVVGGALVAAALLTMIAAAPRRADIESRLRRASGS